jgi:hypothetical protein
LKVNPKYEICSEYPYDIRGIDDGLYMGISLNKEYPTLSLDGKTYYLHRVIAIQFIPNPNNYKEVDHIDKNKSNFHIENLRWVSHSENGKNRKSNKGITYEYFDELPELSRSFIHYYGHEFESYMRGVYTNNMYVWNGVSYRKLPLLLNREYHYFNLVDIYGKKVQVLLIQLEEFY